MSKPSPQEDELRNLISLQLGAYGHQYSSHEDYQLPSARKFHIDQIMNGVRQYAAKARIDELEKLMTDNQQIVRRGKPGTVACLDDGVICHDIKKRIEQLKKGIGDE